MSKTCWGLLITLGCSFSCSPQPQSPRAPSGTAPAATVMLTANLPAAPANTSPTRSVCGFSEPVALGATTEEGWVDVPARHPDIFYVGRFDCSAAGGPTFAYPGTSIRLRFSGEALQTRLLDRGKGTPEATNFYDVIIDDGPAQLLAVSPDTEVYPLANDLSPGVHTLELVKRTESNWGAGEAQLLGFRLRAGGQLLAVSGRPRRLEFVGDSITCGYGNELAVDDPSEFHFTTRNENARLAYGPRVATQLGAEYVLVAASGRGVSRNWQGGAGRHIEAFHALALPDGDAPALWDPARYQPHATIVNAGTNDFSPGGVDRVAFRAAYVSLLEHLRQVYPNTLLLVVLGPMLSDAFPPGESALTHMREDLDAVIQERQRAGETRLAFLELAGQSAPFGEDFHPAAHTHAAMAAAVSAELRRLLGW
jgi:lysophospholipase L1-like esterase